MNSFLYGVDHLGMEQVLQATPDDAQRLAFHGLALAYLGRKAEAMKNGGWFSFGWVG